MHVDEIIAELEKVERRFPEAAVRAAIAQREAITPILLERLQRTADDPEEFLETENSLLPMYAMFLLAQFRERAAYPLLVKLFSAPGEIPFDIAGDSVTEHFDRILASVCGEDLAPIQSMIENPEVNEFVRSSCMRTLAILVAWGDLQRDHAVDYFRSLFNGKLERDNAFLIGALVVACCDIYPEELLSEIRQAYADGIVDSFLIDMGSVEKTLADGKEKTLQENPRNAPITDTVAEMNWWACFREVSPKKISPKPAPKTPKITNAPRVKSVKVGRNQPCPCGSGKKYKKCCGG